MCCDPRRLLQIPIKPINLQEIFITVLSSNLKKIKYGMPLKANVKFQQIISLE